MIQKIRIELPEEVRTGKGGHAFCARDTKIFIDDKQIHNTTDIIVRYPIKGPVTVTLTVLVMDGSEVEFDGFAEVIVERKKEYVDVTSHEKNGIGMPRILLESEA